MNFAIAVKGLIRCNNQFLLIKRRSDEVHGANDWEIPGGRLEPGENPIMGLQREIQEETGLSASVVAPFAVDYFTRKDGQVITMILFLCDSESQEITLSEEHTEFEWILDSELREKICKPLVPLIKQFEKYLAKVA